MGSKSGSRKMARDRGKMEARTADTLKRVIVSGADALGLPPAAHSAAVRRPVRAAVPHAHVVVEAPAGAALAAAVVS